MNNHTNESPDTRGSLDGLPLNRTTPDEGHRCNEDLKRTCEDLRIAKHVPLGSSRVPSLEGLEEQISALSLGSSSRHGVDPLSAPNTKAEVTDITPSAETDDLENLLLIWDELHQQYEQSQQLEDYEKVMSCGEQLIQLIPHNHPRRYSLLTQQSVLHLDQAQQVGTVNDIELSIQYIEKALQLEEGSLHGEYRQLNNLGMGHQLLFDRLGRLEDLQKAISYNEQAVRLIPQDDADRPTCLNNLGTAYHNLFNQLGGLDDLETAISYGQQAVQLMPEDDTSWPDMLSNLSAAYWQFFRHVGRLEYLDWSIGCGEQAVRLMPGDHPHRPAQLNNLGNTYQTLFYNLGRLEDLNRAIVCHEQAIQLTSEGHSDKPRQFNSLGNAYQAMFHHIGKSEDLEKGFVYKKRAVELVPEGDPNRSNYIDDLGNAFEALFNYLGGLRDLEMAITCKEQALQLTSETYSDKSERLNSLGVAYYMRFGRMRRLEDLDKAIDLSRWAVELTPEGHINKAAYLNNLGNAFEGLFGHSGELEYLYTAISYREQAMRLTSEGHPNVAAYLYHISSAYKALFNRMGRLGDLNRAISYSEEAVQLTPHGHPNIFVYLGSLGDAYHILFNHLGQLEHLDTAICYMEQALAPEGYSHRPGQLSSLGSAYQTMFQRTGRLEDLDKAANYQEQAVQLIPRGHPEEYGFLNNLGNTFEMLFDRLGRLEHLDMAISCKEHAMQLAPEGHPHRSRLLINIGDGYQTLFDHLGRLEDLNKAISCKEQGVQHLPSDHPDWLVCVYSLIQGLMARFRHLCRNDDLDAVRTYQELLVQLTGDSHPNLPHCLYVLSHSYMLLFNHGGNRDDLGNSVYHRERAVRLLPDHHTSGSEFRRSLAELYGTRWLRWSDPDDLLKAWQTAREASLPSASPPVDRLRALYYWAILSEVASLSPMDAYSTALALLPQVVWLGTSVQSRYDSLTRHVGDLVNEAVAAATAEQEYLVAIEWLEQGRSIIWTQTLGLRTPLNNLQAALPGVASELEHVSRSLEAASTTSQQNVWLDPEADRTHRWLTKRREQIVEYVRGIGGFEDFLQPLSFDKLAEMLNDGVTVIVHVQQTRTDALVVEKSTRRVARVSLDDFTREKAYHARAQLIACLSARYRSRGIVWVEQTRYSFQQILAMLWSDIVQPILSYLNLTKPRSEDDALPHITWCTTGALSFLPLHAAGDYTDPGTVLANLAVSSYTPSISLLRQPTHDPQAFSGILAVGQELPVRGSTALPGTRLELDQVQSQARQAGMPFTRLNGASACVNAVIQAMASHSWAHFACHGSQNPNNPMKSALCLYDGELDLATIAQQDLKCVQLAFLSACQTATGDPALPDESVHLAAGLMMAGYPTVIGTMWSIEDADAPLVTRKVYEYMLEDGVPNSRKAAKALHRAVAYLRKEIGEEQYGRWMPYIHMGR